MCVGDALLVLANVRLVIHPHEVVWLHRELISVNGSWTFATERGLRKKWE